MANPLENENELLEQIKAENVTIHPIIWKMINHYIGNDLQKINYITAIYIDDGEEIPVEEAKKILKCSESISKFIKKIKEVTKDKEGRKIMAKILIIDDDQDTCDYLKNFFEIRKCAVAITYSGEEGVELCRKLKPNIVLLDIKMEGMDGIEVLKNIKNHDNDIKVIMITVAADEETKQLALNNGANDFVKKPFNIKEVEGIVAKNL